MLNSKLTFWAIGVFGLLWNAMGLLNLIMQQNPATLAQMPPLFQAIVEARPLWATVAFGLAVGLGVIGCILLLMRKAAAVPVFTVSLIAMVVHLFSYLGISNANVHFGVGDIILVVVAPVVVAVWLLGFARRVVRPAST